MGDSRVPTVAAFFMDKVVDMPFVFNDICPWFSVQKTAVFLQLSRSLKVADVPVVQVVLVPQVLSAAMEPVIAATSSFSSTVEVPQIPFIARVSGHSCCATETGTQLSAVAVMAAMKVFLSFFRPFFALLQIVPELSASFSSFRALTTVSARGLQGCRSRHEFHSQVTRHWVCAS